MRIESRSKLRYAWAFAIFWNLVSAPATFLGAVPAIEKGRTVAWIALLFPFIGSALLVWAVHLTLRRWRFGSSWIDLDGGTAILGGSLRATLGAERFPRDSDLRLRLDCIHRTVTGSGKDSSTWEKIVWQEEKLAGPGSLQPGPEGDVLPVVFALPFDAPPTRLDNPRDAILWRLEATARLRGIDYDETFEIPVAAAPPGKAPAGASAVAAAAAPERPAASGVTVEPLAEGGSRFILPAGRNPGAAVGLAAFTLLFAGSGLLFRFLAAGDAPRNPFTWVAHGIIGAGIVFFVLLLLAFTLHTAFLKTSVDASQRGLEVRSSVCGVGWRTAVASADVADITPRIGMQAGSQVYYDLSVKRRNGPFAIGISTMLRDRREAEWLAAEIRRSLR